MSLDDIRNAKGLALLERTEGQSEVSRLELAAKRMADRLRSFAAVYESNPVAVLDGESANLNLHAEAVTLAHQIRDAKAKYSTANAKCKDFGL